MYGWVRRETGGRFALEIRRLWGFPDECDPSGRCNTNIAGARFRVIPSLWGHMAGSGINPPDSEFLSAEIKALLAARREARPNLSFCDFLTGNELFKMLAGVDMVRYVAALHHLFWPGSPEWVLCHE
jgi:hypothetical protein